MDAIAMKILLLSQTCIVSRGKHEDVVLCKNSNTGNLNTSEETRLWSTAPLSQGCKL